MQRDSLGIMKETVLPNQMPDHLGAGAEFIVNNQWSAYPNGVLKLDSLFGDSTLLNPLFGGIESSDKNLFFSNDGNQSDANSVLYVVWIKNSTMAIGQFNRKEENLFPIIPNPNKGQFEIQFSKNQREEMT